MQQEEGRDFYDTEPLNPAVNNLILVDSGYRDGATSHQMRRFRAQFARQMAGLFII